MRYYDTTFDKMFDEALEALEKLTIKQEEYTDEQIEEMYQKHLQRTNISNPIKLTGAQ